MEKAILNIVDRQRSGIINGEEQVFETFQCGNCDETYMIQAGTTVKYCPSCGVKFTKTKDVSA